MTETHELAVMCDTFHPLKLSALAAELDDGRYAYSWADDDASAGARSADEDPAGVTSHF
jgi:homogentisate 1,2-dioxygenase